MVAIDQLIHEHKFSSSVRMVSFSCEVCNDTVIKKRLPQHQRSCRGAYFTCIDCSKTFYGNEHQTHTSCISEAEKYEKSLYKGKKKGQEAKPTVKPEVKTVEKTEPKCEPKSEKSELKSETKCGSKSKSGSKSESKSAKPAGLQKYVSKEETSLYKVFKALKKDNKAVSNKEEFLRALKLKQNDDGSISITL